MFCFWEICSFSCSFSCSSSCICSCSCSFSWSCSSSCSCSFSCSCSYICSCSWRCSFSCSCSCCRDFFVVADHLDWPNDRSYEQLFRLPQQLARSLPEVRLVRVDKRPCRPVDWPDSWCRSTQSRSSPPPARPGLLPPPAQASAWAGWWSPATAIHQTSPIPLVLD